MSKILLDVACLDAGIPPLSLSTSEVIKMISGLGREEKRFVSRKIKKLAKTEINRRCDNIRGKKNKAAARTRLESLTNPKPSKVSMTQKSFALRINLARSLMRHRVSEK